MLITFVYYKIIFAYSSIPMLILVSQINWTYIFVPLDPFTNMKNACNAPTSYVEIKPNLYLIVVRVKLVKSKTVQHVRQASMSHWSHPLIPRQIVANKKHLVTYYMYSTHYACVLFISILQVQYQCFFLRCWMSSAASCSFLLSPFLSR